MNVFRFSNYYKAMMLALLCCGVACFAILYSKGNSKIGLFLMLAVVVMLIAYVLHAFTALLELDGDTLSTRSFTGRRSIKLSEVEDITRIKLKGRYIFFLITMERYVMISTMFNDFGSIKTHIQQHMSADKFKEIAVVSDEDIAKSTRNRNITLFVLLVLFILVCFYFWSR